MTQKETSLLNKPETAKSILLDIFQQREGDKLEDFYKNESEPQEIIADSV